MTDRLLSLKEIKDLCSFNSSCDCLFNINGGCMFKSAPSEWVTSTEEAIKRQEEIRVKRDDCDECLQVKCHNCDRFIKVYDSTGEYVEEVRCKLKQKKLTDWYDIQQIDFRMFNAEGE